MHDGNKSKIKGQTFCFSNQPKSEVLQSSSILLLFYLYLPANRNITVMFGVLTLADLFLSAETLVLHHWNLTRNNPLPTSIVLQSNSIKVTPPASFSPSSLYFFFFQTHTLHTKNINFTQACKAKCPFKLVFTQQMQKELLMIFLHACSQTPHTLIDCSQRVNGFSGGRGVRLKGMVGLKVTI